MSDRPIGYIPGSDLPLTTPGAFDWVVGVDQSTGAMRRFPVPASGAPKAYATRADLPATAPENTPAYVNNDPTASNNGLWAFIGGTWVKSADMTSALQAQIVDVDETLSARMKLGRAVVSGSASTVGKTSSRYLVITREGSLYVERNAGQRAAVIAAVTTPVEIAPHQGLVVDFENGPVDGNGAYIPQVQNIASSSAEGWQSGNRYILVGRDASGGLFGEYNINDSTSPFDGEIAVAASPNGGLPTWNQETRTLTWPQLVIAMRTGEGGDPSQSPRILLSAGSVTVPDSQVSVVYLDLSQVVQSGTPASAVIAVDYLAGPRMEPGGYLPLFCVGRSFAYPVRFPPTVGSASLPAPTPSVSSGDLILTADSATRLHVHIPLVGQADQFMRWTLERLSGETARGMPYDVWQVRGGALATLSGGTSAAVAAIIDNGQLEYAIRKAGDSVFDIGGQAHGNDILDNVVFLVDGAAVSPADLVGEPIGCRRFEVVQHSTVTDTDSTTHIANRTCRWVFEGADLFLSNRLEFVGTLATTIHYGPMPSIVRLSGATQVTDRAMRSPEWTVTDVSGAHSRVNTNSRQVLVWGQESGLSVDTEILEGWNEDSQVHISSELNRNKVYFEVEGAAPSYAPGDVSFYAARIRISHR